MPSRVEWPGYEKLIRSLKATANVDCSPLMKTWNEHLIEGNRKGVLSGIDGFGRPAPPLIYRTGAGKKTSRRQVPLYGTNKHAPVGGVGGNLTTTQYKQLTGPRLAPRGEASRVIKNLMPEIRHPTGKRWEAVCAWFDVASNKGVPFLPYHFAANRGKAQFKRYDLRPVRPETYQRCLNALKDFAKQRFFRSI